MAELRKATVGDTVNLYAFVYANGSGISGQAPTVEIRRLRDGRYWDWGAANWKTVGGTKEGTLAPKVYLAGYYFRQWDQEIADNVPEEYLMIYRNTGAYPIELVETYIFTPSAAESTLDVILNDHISVPGSVGESLALVLGLVQNNFMLDETIHNIDGLLTSGRMRVFDTPVNVPEFGGGSETVGLIGIYRITAVAEPGHSGRVSSYRVERE